MAARSAFFFLSLFFFFVNQALQVQTSCFYTNLSHNYHLVSFEILACPSKGYKRYFFRAPTLCSLYTLPHWAPVPPSRVLCGTPIDRPTPSCGCVWLFKLENQMKVVSMINLPLLTTGWISPASLSLWKHSFCWIFWLMMKIFHSPRIAKHSLCCYLIFKSLC